MSFIDSALFLILMPAALLAFMLCIGIVAHYFVFRAIAKEEEAERRARSAGQRYRSEQGYTHTHEAGLVPGCEVCEALKGI